MTRSLETQHTLVVVLILMGKVIVFSWPAGAFFLAIHPLPLIVENAFTSRPLFLGAPSAALTAVKLWGFVVLLMMLFSGLIFWGIRTNGQNRRSTPHP
jgi:hypothetical protein